MKVDLKKAEDIFEHFELQEHSVYLIRIKTKSTNVEHKSLLLTGFKNGNYCEIYNNSYDGPIKMVDVYSMKVIRKLVKME